MNNMLMSFINAAEADSGSAGFINADLGFIVCLVLGIVFFVLTVLFFFLFDIPKVYLIRTGKGARRTIKKMEEVNAETGRLRKVNEDYMLNSDVPITGEIDQTPSYGLQNPVPAADKSGRKASANAEKQEGGNLTTVLGQSETTILNNSETTVLSGEMAGVGTQTYSYTRKTSQRFDVTFNLMLVHSDEII